MINWGVIGAGNIAHRFCESLSKDKRANLELLKRHKDLDNYFLVIRLMDHFKKYLMTQLLMLYI